MKKCLVLFLFALALVSGCHKKEEPQEKPAQTGPAIGAMAPDFSLQGVDGKTYSLSGLRGKVVLVDFWATWCPPCRESIPELKKLAQLYKGKPFVILGVSLDEGSDVLAQIKKFGRDFNVSYVLLAGTPELVDAYQVDSIPSSFLISKDGRIVQRFFGFSPEIYQILSQDIEQLLK